MAKLQRKTQKVFAGNQTGQNQDQIAVFGSMKTGTPVYSSDIETLQSDEYLEGWSDAILDDKAPYLEEMNGVQYGLSYQSAYILQEGIPEYDAETEYSNTSIVKTVTNGEVVLYASLKSANLGNPLSDVTSWKPYPLGTTKNIGEIVTSTIPLVDANLHLLDGALILGNGIYAEFVSHIASLVATNPNLFVTETVWQSYVAAYGVCGKFVYNSTNNTVRLPKYSTKIYTKDFVANVPVVGNNKSLGLTNNSQNASMTYYASGGAGAQYVASTAGYGQPIGSPATPDSAAVFTQRISWGVTSDADNSGLIAQLSNITTSLDGYYYIVVATSSKTDIQVDIDEIATDLNNKADVDLTNVSAVNMTTAMENSNTPVIIETYNYNNSWYRIWSNGWCEQGGQTTTDTNVSSITVNLLKEFADTSYSLQTQYFSIGGTSGYTYSDRTIAISTTSFTITNSNDYLADGSRYSKWKAEGYLAEGE